MDASDYTKMLETRPANPFEDAEFRAAAEKRQREYETTTLLDRELGLGESEAEIGRDVWVAACADLKSRGVNPDTADVKTMTAALVRVSS